MQLKIKTCRRTESCGAKVFMGWSSGGTMKLSRELFRPSFQTGYRQEILQKVSVLISFLDRAWKNEYLSARFAFKGGTALNTFFLRIPRLSVDIDIDYVCWRTWSIRTWKKRVKFELSIESLCFERRIVGKILELSFRIIICVIIRSKVLRWRRC